MQILSLTRICSNVDTSHWFLSRTVSPFIMQYYFLKWKSLIGWMSFTYSLSTHVTVLLSVDICFSRRFVGLFHQGFKSHYLSSGSMILQWHLENCPNIWRKFWKYTHNWPWKEEKKKAWSRLRVEKEAFLLFLVTVLPAIWFNHLCAKHPLHHCTQLNYISLVSQQFDYTTELQASAFL